MSAMKALVPVLTRAGMRAVFNSERDGMQAKVSHIAFGDRAYSPSGEETKLHNERVRIPIAGGKWVGDFTIHMTALLDSGPSFWIRECGIVLDDGTLLAVWSDPDTPLAYRTDGVPLIAAFDLTLEALPKSAVTVEAGDVDLTLFFAEEFARLTASNLALHHSALKQQIAIDALNRQAQAQLRANAELARRLDEATATIQASGTDRENLLSLIASLAASDFQDRRLNLRKDYLQ